MAGSLRFDDDAGRLVRPFAMASGHDRGNDSSRGNDLDLVTMVVATRGPREEDALRPEHESILRLCATPHSIVEIAAKLELPPGIVRLLVADLLATRDARVGATQPAHGSRMNEDVLRAVLEGLRAL